MRFKGIVPGIFGFWFFHESVSPKSLSIPKGPFQIFSKIRGDIRSSRYTTGGKFATRINSTSETGGKILPPVSLIPVETILMGYSGAGGKLIHEKN
jgi:hypothetical protein